MEFFKQVDIDWMGKAKYFFALSGLLLVVGMASLIAKGGPYYGIDFKGGTVVDVRFAGTPADRHHSQRAGTSKGWATARLFPSATLPGQTRTKS